MTNCFSRSPCKEREPVEELVRRKMEEVRVLDVPLKVEIGWGANWTEAHAVNLKSCRDAQNKRPPSLDEGGLLLSGNRDFLAGFGLVQFAFESFDFLLVSFGFLFQSVFACGFLVSLVFANGSLSFTSS